MAYTRVRRLPSGEIRDDMIRRDSDGAHIPADPLNHDWQAYQSWLKAGSEPSAADPAVPGPSVVP